MGLYKYIARFLGIAAFLSLFFISSSVSAYTIGAVEGNNVNIRSEASLNANVITQFNNGHLLNIIDIEDEFYKIDVDGLHLYIAKQFAQIYKGEGTITTSDVNLRQYPSTDAESLGRLMAGLKVEVLGSVDDWYKISSNGKEGYVSSDCIEGWSLQYVERLTETMADAAITAKETILNTNKHTYENMLHTSNQVNDTDTYYGIVTAHNGLRLREAASTDADIITVLSAGAPLEVYDIDGEWLLVNHNGYIGHVNSEFVSLRQGQAPSGSELAHQIIEYGKQFLGTPYVWAGNNLNTGVDCSGFVYEVFRAFGITLNRSSATMVQNGRTVDKNELIPGDLVFFDTFAGENRGNISHVGIYMGNGQFIHSSSSQRTWGVTISSLEEEYYMNTYVTASRVLN